MSGSTGTPVEPLISDARPTVRSGRQARIPAATARAVRPPNHRRSDARRRAPIPSFFRCRRDTSQRMAFVPSDRHLLRARDLADARYFEPLSVEDLARAAGLSRGHFSLEFRRAFGESPHAYLLTRRLERAAALLRTTDRSIAEVCLAVGLHSVGSFTTSFTRTFGVSPTVYRSAFPPASVYARLPACVVRAYGRPQHRTFREDTATSPS